MLEITCTFTAESFQDLKDQMEAEYATLFPPVDDVHSRLEDHIIAENEKAEAKEEKKEEKPPRRRRATTEALKEEKPARKRGRPKKEPAPPPPAPEEGKEPVEVTAADGVKAATEGAEKLGPGMILQILEEDFKVKNVSELDPQQLREFVETIKFEMPN